LRREVRRPIFNDVTDKLPTIRSTHRDGYLCVLVWCRACHHQAPADLEGIIDSGRGDIPLKDLTFLCTKCCTSEHTDAVVMAKDALRVQPYYSYVGN
jgi:hypothetical protein